jgi:hypothetical protein
MLIKTYLKPEAVEFLKANVTEYWTNETSGMTYPQYYVTLANGQMYLLDIWEETHELISVTSVEQLDDETLESMADTLSQSEYVQLCVDIEKRVLDLVRHHKLIKKGFQTFDVKLGMSPKVTSDNLFAFINKLNENYLKGLSK